MNAVLDKLPALVDEELENANVFHTVFHSPHEGYAVLLEEVEEAKDNLLNVGLLLNQMWKGVKADDEECCREMASLIEKQAVMMAAEAIQVAAMARKFQAIEDGWTPDK